MAVRNLGREGCREEVRTRAACREIFLITSSTAINYITIRLAVTRAESMPRCPCPSTTGAAQVRSARRPAPQRPQTRTPAPQALSGKRVTSELRSPSLCCPARTPPHKGSRAREGTGAMSGSGGTEDGGVLTQGSGKPGCAVGHLRGLGSSGPCASVVSCPPVAGRLLGPLSRMSDGHHVGTERTCPA